MAVTFHVVQRMAPGGIESIVLDLARRNPDIRVISLEGERHTLVRDWPQLADLGDRLLGLAKADGIKPGLWRRLRDLFAKAGAGAVITHHIGPLVYAGLAAQGAKISRRIHVEHDGWHYAQPRRRFLARVLDHLVRPRRVAVSMVTADQVAQALGTLRQTVIPNGVDLARFVPADQLAARQRFGLPAQGAIIGSVGRLEKVKGHDVLIDAARFLPDDVTLVLAGDGTERANLQARIAAHGLAHRVLLLGTVDHPEHVLPAFDLFCLPSRAEGFPRSLIEAQACNLVVIACDVGGVREAVCPSTGHLVPPENPLALAKALMMALGERTPVSPRLFVDPVFSNDLMAERYRALAED